MSNETTYNVSLIIISDDNRLILVDTWSTGLNLRLPQRMMSFFFRIRRDKFQKGRKRMKMLIIDRCSDQIDWLREIFTNHREITLKGQSQIQTRLTPLCHSISSTSASFIVTRNRMYDVIRQYNINTLDSSKDSKHSDHYNFY